MHFTVFVRITHEMNSCTTSASLLPSPFPRSLHAEVFPVSKVTLTSRILMSRKPRAKVNERWQESLLGVSRHYPLVDDKEVSPSSCYRSGQRNTNSVRRADSPFGTKQAQVQKQQ